MTALSTGEFDSTWPIGYIIGDRKRVSNGAGERFSYTIYILD